VGKFFRTLTLKRFFTFGVRITKHLSRRPVLVSPLRSYTSLVFDTLKMKYNFPAWGKTCTRCVCYVTRSRTELQHHLTPNV